ncbi:MAG: tetratricopeptide (TPR) repeat protein [Pseudohongiellaceae bacterium]|jgi:tetratricopeptide (TPR) repeat protein
MFESVDSPLDQSTSDQLRKLCMQGYDLYDQHRYKSAVRHFFKAWALLPKPQTHFQEAGWVLTALGDSYFKLANYTSSIEALKSAFHCPETNKNPFIHLRLGQCYYQTEQMDMAKIYLQTAHSLGGIKPFFKEDSCYIDLIQPST